MRSYIDIKKFTYHKKTRVLCSNLHDIYGFETTYYDDVKHFYIIDNKHYAYVYNSKTCRGYEFEYMNYGDVIIRDRNNVPINRMTTWHNSEIGMALHICDHDNI